MPFEGCRCRGARALAPSPQAHRVRSRRGRAIPFGDVLDLSRVPVCPL